MTVVGLGEVKTQDQQLQELRDVVLAIAVALGDALPATREFISKLDALVDTNDAVCPGFCCCFPLGHDGPCQPPL